MSREEVMNDLQYPKEPEKVPAYIFEYDCQICGGHNTAILHASRLDPIAICPECAKRIKKLIYQEDDLK